MKTDIEVIVPAYIPNDINLTYFIQALESLQNQTLTNFIARIIINGGFNICSKIPKDDRFDIRVMDGKQSGAKARNYGMKLGDSKYVAQLDADDLYMPDKLQKQFDFMENNKWCSLLATSILVLTNGKLKKSCYSNEEIGTHDQIKSCIRDITQALCSEGPIFLIKVYSIIKIILQVHIGLNMEKICTKTGICGFDVLTMIKNSISCQKNYIFGERDLVLQGEI